jgi:DNA repair protein RecO (recombination protein O)
MSLKKSEAILLKAFNWSESSRTVVFFSRDYGRIALVDKGGRSFKSKRGRLLPFARMELTFYDSERETRAYLRDIELIQEFQFESDGNLGRLAYASAACELLNALLGEEEAQEDLYEYTCNFLAHIAKQRRGALPALFVTYFLKLCSHLGYHPSLTTCVVSGRSIDPDDETLGELRLYPERGGIVHPSCQKPVDYYIPVSLNSFRKLVLLQRSSLTEAARVTLGFNEASVMLEALVKFLSYQAEIKAELKSLKFLEKLKNTDLRTEKEDNEREEDKQ